MNPAYIEIKILQKHQNKEKFKDAQLFGAKREKSITATKILYKGQSVLKNLVYEIE